jgi:hypothetical protein
MPAVTPQHDRGLRHQDEDHQDEDHEEHTMTTHYPNPALEAELAYRRERLERAGQRIRRARWLANRRRTAH